MFSFSAENEEGVRSPGKKILRDCLEEAMSILDPLKPVSLCNVIMPVKTSMHSCEGAASGQALASLPHRTNVLVKITQVTL